MDLSNIKIETIRLLLASITLEYVEEIYSEFSAEITLYMFPKSAAVIDETKDFISQSLNGLKAGSNLQLVILAKASKEFLGCVGLHEIDKPKPELGIWLKKSAHGNAYGLEAITALKKWADEHVDYETLTYPVDERNLASRRIPESLGGQVTDRYTEKSASGRTLHIIKYEIPKGK